MTDGAPAAHRQLSWRRRLTFLGIGTVLAGGLAYGLFTPGSIGPTSAPSFSIPRLGGGAPVVYSSVGDRPAVVVFFASWCAPCHAELPALAKAIKAATARGSGVRFIGVDVNDDPSAAQAFVHQSGVTFAVGRDSDDAVIAGKFQLPGVPDAVLIGANGVVLHTHYGPLAVATLDSWLSSV